MYDLLEVDIDSLYSLGFIDAEIFETFSLIVHQHNTFTICNNQIIVRRS